MKKFRFRMTSIVFTLVIVATITTILPSNAQAAGGPDAYYITYSRLQPEWSEKTEMVNWSTDQWTTDWVNYLIGNNSGFIQIVEAAYRATVSNVKYNTNVLDAYVDYNGRRTQLKAIPNEDLGFYIEQLKFSQILDSVAAYQGGKRVKPELLCGDIVRLMVGLLRSKGIPAYIEVGRQLSSNRFHSRVAIVDKNNGRIYYSDPTFGVTDDTAKWMWLSNGEYSDNYTRQYVSTERLPSKGPSAVTPTPPATNPNSPPPVVRPEYPVAQKINVPAKDRYEVTVPVTKNGGTELIGNVPMRIIWYDSSWWFTVRDVAMVIRHTERSVNIRWSTEKSTIIFAKNSYAPNGSETNWTKGENIPIDSKAQAIMLPPAFFGEEQTDIRIVMINGVTYARPIDIAEMMDFDGSVAIETELGGNFVF